VRRGIEWYSATADDPVMCRAKWADKPRRARLLRTGRLFGVVVISRRIGLETFGQLVCREALIGSVTWEHESQQVGSFLGRHRGEPFEAVLAARVR
jgi:hypothetical protein